MKLRRARRCPIYFLGEMIREREKVVPLPWRNFLSIVKTHPALETPDHDHLTMPLQGFNHKPSSTKWRPSKQCSGSRIRRRRSDSFPPFFLSFPLLNPHQTKTNEGGMGETDAKMQRPDPRKHPQTRPRHVPTQTTGAKNQTIHTPIVQKRPKTTLSSQTSRGRDPHLRPRTRPHPQTKLPPGHKQSPITERTDASE